MICLDDEAFQLYIDGEVPPEEVKSIEKHIADCESCALKVENQRRLADGVKKAIDLLAEEDINIPDLSKKGLNTRRRLIYLAAAACIILFVLFIPKNKKDEIQKEAIIFHSLDWDYDANKTVSQQPMVIHFIDVDGEIIKYYID
jgi:hypothetical protein